MALLQQLKLRTLKNMLNRTEGTVIMRCSGKGGFSSYVIPGPDLRPKVGSDAFCP